MRRARPLFGAGHYHFQYKLKAIMPCTTEEWSGHHARLQSVLYGFLPFWVHYFSDFSIQAATMAKWWQWQRQRSTGQLQLGGEPCILLQCTCTTTYQVTTCVKHLSRFDRINKPLVLAKISRKQFSWLRYSPQRQQNLLSLKFFRYTVVEIGKWLSVH